jgi:hypothetical protein
LLTTNIHKVKDIPFLFIIGRPRSGTTLLQLFFDAHPNVQIPSECMHIVQLYIHYAGQKKWDGTIIKQFIKDFSQTWMFTFEKFNIVQLERDLNEIADELNVKTAFKLIAKNYNSIYPKQELLLFGDKNPYYSQVFQYIFPLIENAKFIHLIRDPRDSYISQFNTRFVSPSITYNTIRWLKSVKTLDAYSKVYPNRIYTLRYEDLVAYPEKYLTEMCSFLNIPFAPEMLKYLDKKEELTTVAFVNDYYKSKYHLSVCEKVNTHKINQWKKRLGPGKIKKAEKIAGIWLEKYGYEKQFSSPGFWSNFSTLPGKILFRFIEWERKQVKYLPKKWQLKIALKSHVPFLYWWKFYGNKKL